MEDKIRKYLKDYVRLLELEIRGLKANGLETYHQKTKINEIKNKY